MHRLLLNRSLRLKPHYAEAHNNRGYALDELGRSREALSAYDEALRIKSDYAIAYNNRGTALNDLGRLDEALHAYDQALQLKPNYAEAHINRGMAFQNLGHIEAAIHDFSRALELKPNAPGALAGYCSHRSVSSDHPAVEVLEAALANPWMKDQHACYFHFALGRLYADREQPSSAFEHYQRGLSRISWGSPGSSARP